MSTFIVCDGANQLVACESALTARSYIDREEKSGCNADYVIYCEDGFMITPIKATERKRAGKLVKVADGVAVGKVKEYMSQSRHICTGKLMIGCNKPLNITFDYFGNTLLIHEWWMIEPETRETVTDIVTKYFESIAA